MEEFVTVAQNGDVPQGTGATFTVEDRLIALFHTTDGYRAIDNWVAPVRESIFG